MSSGVSLFEAEGAALVGSMSRKDLAPQQDDSIRSVFSSLDLLVNILCPLIGGDFLSLSLVSKNFHQATLSNQLWREMCHQRWKGKWGGNPRWEKALMDYSNYLNDQQKHIRGEPKAADNFWKSRYFFEEQDATRKLILAEELELLVFDFRFWIGQPSVVGERIVVKSGLLQSASREVRFTRPEKRDTEEQAEEEEMSVPTWSVRGRLTGHPCKENGIEWFLDESSGVLQWGFPPNLWPQGSIQRLDNWGWQLQNPNVCLRSIDPLPRTAPIAPKMSDWDETKLDEIERECSKNHGLIGAGDHLWKDLIDSLENVPLAAPLVNGCQVTADIPRSFIGQYEE